jgi:ribA/ribD-fused uncharacterized protein
MTITDKYVFFYGSEFSQWYKRDMTMDGRIYNCAEQYMMHRKALLFEDFEVARMIMTTKHPSDQKALGRQVKNFNKEQWDAVVRDIVYQANLAKFVQHDDLKTLLIDLGKDRKFVEASPYDTIWGIGLSEKDPLIMNPVNWKGTNWLGETLDRVRVKLS